MPLTDHFGRSIHDCESRSRIDATIGVFIAGRDQWRGYAELPFDDYLRMARILVGLGITKIRLTGGEPLLRKGNCGICSRPGEAANAGRQQA